MSEPGFGQWHCKTCGDTQFGTNRVCRQCGAPNPDVLAAAAAEAAASLVGATSAGSAGSAGAVAPVVPGGGGAAEAFGPYCAGGGGGGQESSQSETMAAMMQMMSTMISSMSNADGYGKWGGKAGGSGGGKGGKGGGWDWSSNGWTPYIKGYGATRWPNGKWVDFGDKPKGEWVDMGFGPKDDSWKEGWEKKKKPAPPVVEEVWKRPEDPPDIVMLQIPASCTVVQQGFPRVVMAIPFDKNLPIFGESHHILQSLMSDHSVADLVQFDHDPDCERYPEIAQEWKAAGWEDNFPTVARISALKVWAIGMGGQKNALRAAKLALAITVAGVVEPRRLQETKGFFPNFERVLASLVAKASQPVEAPPRSQYTTDQTGAVLGSLGRMA